MKYNNIFNPVFGRIVCVFVMMFYTNIAFSELEKPVNGLIVKANNSNEAVDSAFKRMLNLINDVIARKDGSTEIFNRDFGNWLSKKGLLIDSESEPVSNEIGIRRLLEPVGGRVTEILIPSAPPQRISESPESEPRYYAIVALRNSKFKSAVVFIAVEKISDLGDGKYDVALVPGRFFVGDPSGTGTGVSPK